MERFLTLALAGTLSFLSLHAQTCDIVVFSDMGDKFTLMVDGAEVNATPASRVVASSIRNETPSLLVRFADASKTPIKQNGYFPLGKEYTVVITTNKKGQLVLRPSGEAELGTASKAEDAKPKPTTFVEDAPAEDVVEEQTVDMNVGGQTVTTTTVVEESADGVNDMDGENVNMSFGVNGMGVNMNVNVNGTGTGTTTGTSTAKTTTTTTTTTKVTQTGAVAVKPVTTTKPETTAVLEPVYKMPGYNGPVGCGYPMSSSEFDEAKASISSKGFEDTKMTLVKQIGRDRCFTVDQVKGLMGLFSFEDNKLDLAKFAYDHTYDIGNYYKVNDVFSFESSVEDLNEYIKSR
ncbi:MAG: DUF4476 domain-containing protein [Flavobacteriales bacterium]|nr:DUF4476 domain-containing protein [Flavobacteriales bacterium]